MKQSKLYSTFESLPPNLKKEVNDFVELSNPNLADDFTRCKSDCLQELELM